MRPEDSIKVFGYDRDKLLDDELVQKYSKKLELIRMLAEPRNRRFSAGTINAACTRYEREAYEFLRELGSRDQEEAVFDEVIERLSVLPNVDKTAVIEDRGLPAEFPSVCNPAAAAMIELILRCGQVRHYISTQDCQSAATATWYLSRPVASFRSIARGGSVARGKRVRQGGKKGYERLQPMIEKANLRKAGWQARAREKWGVNPRLPASQVAAAIAAEDNRRLAPGARPTKARTVRAAIKKPSPS